MLLIQQVCIVEGDSSKIIFNQNENYNFEEPGALNDFVAISRLGTAR